MNKENYVRKLPFWNMLDEQEKTIVMRQMTERFYQKGENILCFCDASLGMVFVLDGAIRVSLISAQGRDITLFHIEAEESCILSASCIVGELSLKVSLTALKDTKLLAVHVDCLQRLIEQNLFVRCFAFELSTKRLSAVVRVMQQILFLHLDERMARYLLSVYEKTGERTIKMTQEVLAKEVNSAREAVTRMLKVFGEEGWIKLNRGTIFLRDLNALKKLAQNDFKCD